MKPQIHRYALLIIIAAFLLISSTSTRVAQTRIEDFTRFDFGGDVITKEGTLIFKLDDLMRPQAVFNVNTTAGTFDGVCDANCSLRDAVHASNQNGTGLDTINVPAGTYTLDVVDNNPGDGNNALPVVTGEVIIQGAGAASTFIARSSAGGTPDFRFFKTTGGILTLNGLTLRNGRANGMGGVIVLGGNNSDRLTVNNCLFENNVSANNSGGAIGAFVGQTEINNSTFTNNSTLSGGGGAIYGGIFMVSLTITNSVFTGNNTPGNGGAIANDQTSGSIVISGSTFTGNMAGEGGGAIFSSTAFNATLPLNISNSTFSGNSSVSQSGGAIVGPQINIDRSTISGNSSSAGAIITNNSSPNTSITISNSTISGNNSSPTGSVGAAIHGTAVTVTNSTVSGNSGARGAGIQAGGGGGSLNLNNVTVTGNTANSNVGGGIFIFSGTPSTIRNSIIAGNTATGGGHDCSGSIVSQGYNLIGNGDGCSFTPTTGDQVGTTATPINPQIGQLQNNGGPTFTQALLEVSTAINAGNPATPNGTGNNCLPTDQRGVNRGLAGPTQRCDIGAFESSFSATVPAPRSRADFDGDGKTDVSVFRPSEGNWYLNRSGAGFGVVKWGISTDTVVPGDYDNDGKADFAVFRPDANPANPDYYILNSNKFIVSGVSWGLPGDIPVTGGDYDGDGKTDVAVFRPTNTNWYILKSGGGITVNSFGLAGDQPFAADFDGDGKADQAVFRPGAQAFFYFRGTLNNPGGNITFVPFGITGDQPVVADYDGDNKDDVAVFRPSNGTWYIRRSSNGAVDFILFGLTADVPVPGDYDGDGKDDVAVYRNGTWYLNRSTSGFFQTNFGLASDVPIPKKYIP